MNSKDNLPAIIDVIYSYDTIRFISKLSIPDVRKQIPERELKKHCIPRGDSLVKVHIDETGREWGYITKVEASACNDEFVNILKGCDPGILSHLQVARDLIFETMAEANAYMEWFEQNAERLHNRHSFKIGTTLFLGKQYGDNTKSYIRCYVRESKLTGMPCLHTEFVLEGAGAIKKALGIKSHKELTASIESYFKLENSYFRIKESGVVKGVKFGSLFLTKCHYDNIAKRIKRANDTK
ncbi:MAG: hypothetical protein JZU65_15855 [Chlorobium sp.]|nr:hypothetical protein [Chlorobium sp.]